jgi:DNA replication and repair protein RecF
MPVLARLELSNFRNIDRAALDPAPGFNLFVGNNGSGKTSLLEGIHLLALGRSFRTHLHKALIQTGKADTTAFGQTTEGLTLGVLRPVRGPQVLRLGGRKAEGLVEMSRSLPLQLINADTFQILEGSPTERRRFLDWGVFHVEHQFLDCWRRARLALQNRNSLLRLDAKAAEIEPWTQELVRSAGQMDSLRGAYVAKLRTALQPILDRIGLTAPGQELVIDYHRGWTEGRELHELLDEDLLRDRKFGHTGAGPHRADLKFRLGAVDAVELLSRGQVKLLICALKIAQGQLLERERGQRCLFLIDDLPAELDSQNRARVCSLLGAGQAQVFLTCIDAESLPKSLLESAEKGAQESKLFHVKHGKIDKI